MTASQGRDIATVERLGGRVIVQDPADAAYDSMPRCALATTRHPESARSRGHAISAAASAPRPRRRRWLPTRSAWP